MTSSDHSPGAIGPAPDALHTAPAGQDGSALLDHLSAARGFDFHGYKPTSLARRIRKRMAVLGIETYAAYHNYLQTRQEELLILFDTILINVTAYFRDPGAWQFIKESVIPEIRTQKRRDEPIRIWSASCASGEEAYTLAIVLAEALGIDEFRNRAKIYATDIDDDALATARHATYTARQIAGVPARFAREVLRAG